MKRPQGEALYERFKRACALTAASSGASRRQQLIERNSFVKEAIRKSWLVEERELQFTRWIEYRYLSLLQCTQLFTKLYEEAVRDFYGKYFDFSKKDDLRPIQTNYVRNQPRELSQLWRARQEADRMGAPYGFFIRTAMESMLTDEGHKMVPRPNQLYSKRPLKWVAFEWAKWEPIETLFRDEWDPRFFADRYVGDDVQDAALGMLYRRVMAASHPAMTLKSFLLNRRAISEHEARRRFGDSLVDEALDGSVLPAVSSASITPRRLVPACLGLALDEMQPRCRSCFALLECRQATRAIEADHTARFGEPDALAMKRKADNRARQQKCRARKRGNPIPGSGG